MRGILDRSFDGKRLAASFRASKVVIDLRNARRIASSAVPHWTDFVTAVMARPDADMYIVECEPHVLGQFNMLVGLQGKSKIVSFYAPYRCGTCSSEFEVLMLLPRDRPIIRDLNPPEHPCPKCGGRSEIDDDPASFFSAVSTQPYFDIDHEVGAYLRARYKYQFAADASRLHVERHSSGAMTYVRIGGNIDRAFPLEAVTRALSGNVILDLGGAKLVDQGGVIQWRGLIRAVQPFVSSLTLIECPPGFLERALVPEDVDDRLQVLTFQVEYECANCSTRVTRTVDAEINHVDLRSATFPPVHCATCAIAMTPLPSEDLLALLRIIKRPAPAPALRRFAAKSAKRSSKRLTDVLLARPTKSLSPALLRVIYVTAAMVVVIVGIQAFMTFRLQQRQTVVQTQSPAAAATRAPQALERPPWIVSDTPSSSYCHDLINHFMCVGVSAYQKNRDAATLEANDAALEELANAVAIKISDDAFRQKIVPMFQEPRQRALGALETTVDRANNATYDKLLAQVRDTRKQVAEALRAVGGAAVPAQRSDWYWEEYAVEKGTGSDYLVFVRYDISLDSIKSLVERYSRPVEVMESSVVNVFPSLAWPLPHVKGGAMFVRVGGPLVKTGLKNQSIVTAISSEAVRDTAQLSERLKPGVSLTAIQSPAENSPPQTLIVPESSR